MIISGKLQVGIVAAKGLSILLKWIYTYMIFATHCVCIRHYIWYYFSLKWYILANVIHENKI